MPKPPVSSPSPATSTSYPVLSDDLLIALSKGKRQFAHPISSFCSYDRLSTQSCSFIASLDSISLPNKVSEALTHPGWHSTMIKEMDALTDNGTWDLVRLPAGKKAIGCCWMFRVKVNPDGSIVRLKARIVAKRYAQTYGVDYSGGGVYGTISKVCCSRRDKEGLLSSEIFVWFETESACMVW